VLPRRVAALALVLVAASGCTSDEEPSAAPPSPTATALSDLGDLRDSTVTRDGEWCFVIGPDRIDEALGAEHDAGETWEPGSRLRVADGVRDVVHEYGCRWTAGDQVASAWVFAPPVTGKQAHRWGRAAAHAEGCQRVRDAERFGTHSLAVTCETDGIATTTYRGLFGDAWLSCALTGTDAGSDSGRADAWCAAVAEAATTPGA
jgi:hypothetical protein